MKLKLQMNGSLSRLSVRGAGSVGAKHVHPTMCGGVAHRKVQKPWLTKSERGSLIVEIAGISLHQITLPENIAIQFRYFIQ